MSAFMLRLEIRTMRILCIYTFYVEFKMLLLIAIRNQFVLWNRNICANRCIRLIGWTVTVTRTFAPSGNNRIIIKNNRNDNDNRIIIKNNRNEVPLQAPHVPQLKSQHYIPFCFQAKNRAPFFGEGGLLLLSNYSQRILSSAETSGPVKDL